MYRNYVLICLEEGAKQCLPRRQNRRPAVPGWNIHARSLQKNRGTNFGVSVVAHLQESCSSLRRVPKRDISTRYVDFIVNSNI